MHLITLKKIIIVAGASSFEVQIEQTPLLCRTESQICTPPRRSQTAANPGLRRLIKHGNWKIGIQWPLDRLRLITQMRIISLANSFPHESPFQVRIHSVRNHIFLHFD